MVIFILIMIFMLGLLPLYLNAFLNTLKKYENSKYVDFIFQGYKVIYMHIHI
jgi:hypothetical protein